MRPSDFGRQSGRTGLRIGVERMEKILIVDDAKINRTILKQMLKEQYETLEAEDGREAVDVFRQYQGQIKAVLLDAVMPVANGFDFLTEAKKEGWLEKAPVIMVSTDCNENAVRRALDGGASDFIARPFDRETVIHKVNAIAS